MQQLFQVGKWNALFEHCSLHNRGIAAHAAAGREGLMDIAKAIEGLMELARRSNMTFGELLEWLSQNDRDEETLPWEE